MTNETNRAPVSAPTAGGERQSIDTDEFWDLISECHAGYQYGPISRHDRAKAALIAHIDTWAARSAAEAVPAGWAVSRLDSAFQRDAVRVIASSGDAVTLRKDAPEPWERVLYRYFDSVAAPAPGNTVQPAAGD